MCDDGKMCDVKRFFMCDVCCVLCDDVMRDDVRMSDD